MHSPSAAHGQPREPTLHLHRGTPVIASTSRLRRAVVGAGGGGDEAVVVAVVGDVVVVGVVVVSFVTVVESSNMHVYGSSEPYTLVRSIREVGKTSLLTVPHLLPS